MAHILVDSPNRGSKKIDLAGEHSLGRHPGQDVQIMDRLVSKQHCIIRKSGDGWVILDAGSRNGTFVNNKKIEGELVLTPGDRLMVGATRITFVDDKDPSHVEDEVDMTEMGAAPVIQTVMDAEDALEFFPSAQIKNPDDLRRDYEKLRFAYQLHRAIAGEWELKVLLGKVLEMILSFLPSLDRAMILLRDPESGDLYPAKSLFRPGVDTSKKIAVSRAIVNRVVQDKKGMLTNDAAVDDRFDGSHSIMMQGIRSAMAVPMMGHDARVIGMLHVDSLRKIGAFTERDLNVIQGFASQAALTVENAYFADKVKTDAATREKFQRFLSPNLVARVLNGELDFEKGGEERHVTILFSDIRQFTALAERHPAGTIVELLNRYFERMAEVVFDYDGTLDKFIGDALMGLWGAPLSTGKDIENAVRAAVRMQAAMREFNVEAEGIIGEHIQIGIGIDSGPVVAGLMGSSRTMNYTVIGSNVNRSARLCSKAKPGEILVSQTVFNALNDMIPCRAVEPMALKGFEKLVPVFSVSTRG